MVHTLHSRPDFSQLLCVFLRQGEPEYLPFIELFADHEIMEAVLGESIPRPNPAERDLYELYLRKVVQFYHQTGYDYVIVSAVVNLPYQRLRGEDTAPLKRMTRLWEDQHHGPIMSWEDFECYPWPRPAEMDFYRLEYTARILPEGMQMIYLGPGGQLENMSSLMSYTHLCTTLYDDPALVEAVAGKVGEVLVSLYETAAQMPGVGALWLGDDMGFKSGTLISPHHLRQYVFPWQKKLAEIAHNHNLPFLLHSCGNLERIMDDLIHEVKIDARHSFEDNILPAAQAKQRYGSKVAILGGVDMDVLARGSEEEVRACTRSVIEACAPGGGYALGTGNTVANYIPVRNYLAMLDEGRRL